MDATFLKPLASHAIDQLLSDMRNYAPSMAVRAESWMSGLTKTGVAADYFQHPLAFPMLLLPCWVEESIRGQVDADFQADLVYSSVSGYYFIRMIDNVMDEDSELERALLPMAGFFHAQATTTYYRYFEHQHSFWGHFRYWNTQSAELAIEDSAQDVIDLETFQRIAGKKVVAGKIPIAAVLAHYGQLDHMLVWEHFYDKLSCWHQMFNDVLSWHKDLQYKSPSYFLSEAHQHKYEHETVLAWLLREGFAWGLKTLHQWLDELFELADMLNSSYLKTYLANREHLLKSQQIDFTSSITAMSQLIHMTEPMVVTTLTEGKAL